MRRQDSLSPIVHQSLMRSQIACVSECVCNYRVFDALFMGFDTFNQYVEQSTLCVAAHPTERFFIDFRHRVFCHFNDTRP